MKNKELANAKEIYTNEVVKNECFLVGKPKLHIVWDEENKTFYNKEVKQYLIEGVWACKRYFFKYREGKIKYLHTLKGWYNEEFNVIELDYSCEGYVSLSEAITYRGIDKDVVRKEIRLLNRKIAESREGGAN